MPSPLALSLLSVTTISLTSFAGVLVFMLFERPMRRLLLLLVGFSAGALLGDVFIHMFPEMLSSTWQIVAAPFLLVLVGMLLSFVIEKIIHWRHCHCSALPRESMHVHPVGIMNLIGDGLHNFIDGAIIAGSFLISPVIGFTTTLAVILHEIPQEIGDFAVLLYSGFPPRKAVLFNVLSACTAFLGVAAVFLSYSAVPALTAVLLPLAAGNFLYIAGADLIPELHKESRLPHAVLQFTVILLGAGTMMLLTVID